MPLLGFYNTKRIELYDDELYFSDTRDKDGNITYLSQVEKVQMSSEPKRNFMLVQMDNTIYKYDLITKELLFRWKTTSNSEIILFDKDDRLCTVAPDCVRLWDFYDGTEQPPAIWATEEFGKNERVDKVFINEGSDNDNKIKDSTCDDDFFVVVIGSKFRIYRNRLEFTYVECTYDNPEDEDYKGPDEKVTAAAFSEHNDTLFLGTSLGYIRYINLQALVNINEENYQEEGTQRDLVPRKPYQVDPNSNMPITSMNRFVN
jgi:WD40 repeat protein